MRYSFAIYTTPESVFTLLGFKRNSLLCEILEVDSSPVRAHIIK